MYSKILFWSFVWDVKANMTQVEEPIALHFYYNLNIYVCYGSV